MCERSERLGLTQKGRGRNLVVFLQVMGSHGRLLSEGSPHFQQGPPEKAWLQQRGQAGWPWRGWEGGV